MKCKKLENGKWELIPERPSDLLFLEDFKNQLQIEIIENKLEVKTH